MEKFDARQYVTNLRGKDYLEVKWRLVWFRNDHPFGMIATDLVSVDPPIVKAEVWSDGAKLATGYASAPSGKNNPVWIGREIEKAETAAIGRALAHSGYGTQFTGESEDENLADSPVERKPEEPKTGRPYTPAILKEKLDEVAAGYAAEIAAGGKKGATDNVRAVLASGLEQIFPDKTNRYEFSKWATGESSTKRMDSRYVFALMKWMKVNAFEDVVDPLAKREALSAHPAALVAAGQQSLPGA